MVLFLQLKLSSVLSFLMNKRQFFKESCLWGNLTAGEFLKFLVCWIGDVGHAFEKIYWTKLGILFYT